MKILAKDPYFDTQRCIDRLMGWYEKHDNLIIAFDFDDTIYDFHNKGFKYPSIVKLLRQCSRLDFTTVLFSASKKERYPFMSKYLEDYGIKVHYINESPVVDGDMFSKKPYYNILLDDKSGLGQAYHILYNVVEQVKNKRRKS